MPLARWLALVLGALAPLVGETQGEVTLVACAPGYPGTTAEAQPSMDALAQALARVSGWPAGSVGAVYEATEQGGRDRLGRGGPLLALVTLPFLVKYGAALKLVPHLAVEQKGVGLEEVWSLVAKKGRVSSPGALAGFTLSSIAGYAPAFVRGALSGFGEVPGSTRIAASSQVLSALRRAAAGEDLAVLLDGEESAALGSLPFASELEVVARSQPLPAAFVCTVGDALPPARYRALERGLVALSADPGGAAALEGIRMVRFVPAPPAALALYRALGEKAGR